MLFCPRTKQGLAIIVCLGVAIPALQSVSAAEPQSNFRLRLRYTVEGNMQRDAGTIPKQSEYLSGRVRTGFTTPWGVFVQSGVSQYDSTMRAHTWWRDEAYWKFKAPGSDLEYRAGDLSAGTGLGWVQAYDMTGFQLRRRSGNAAVETVEALTPDPALLRNVAPQEWSWAALPDIPTQATAGLLNSGVSEFAFQSGYLRLDRGGPQARHDPEPIYSAALRHGVLDNLTMESYIEASRRMRNRGGGLVAGLGRYGTLGLAGTFSEYGGRTGSQWAATYTGGLGPVSYFAAIQYRSPDYFDISRMSRQRLTGIAVAPLSRIDTVGAYLPMTASALRMNYVRLVSTAAAPDTSLLNISYAAAMGEQAWWYSSAYTDLADDEVGVYLGISLPFGGGAGAPTPPAASSSTFAFGPTQAGQPTARRASATWQGSAEFDSAGEVQMHTSLEQNYIRAQPW